MSMKLTLDSAREAIVAGHFPKNVVADNKKTGCSILDNVPHLTCYGICPIRDKCYDVKILNLRPNVLKARALRHYMIELAPGEYIDRTVKEILSRKATKVRVYGGGDFTPLHMPILLAIMTALPSITFYMISKTIREYPLHALTLLSRENFFLNLSECADYHFGEDWTEIAQHQRVNRVYTFLDSDTDFAKARKADIVFNVSKSKKNISIYKSENLALCPCDAKDIPSQGACEDCGLCATKGGVRNAFIRKI